MSHHPLPFRNALSLTAAVAGLAFSLSASAGLDCFMKIDGVDGDSQDSRHPHEIVVKSFSWAENSAGSGMQSVGMGSGRVNMQDFHFTMASGLASPGLMARVAQGTHLKGAVLTCRRAGGKQSDFSRWTFSDVMVTSFQTGWPVASDELPLDTVTLNFIRIEYNFIPLHADGTSGAPVAMCWDLKTNSVCR